MTAKANTNQRLKILEEVQGLSTTKYLSFDRAIVSKLSAALPAVNVSVTEARKVGYFSAATEAVDAGFYERVVTESLLDITTWFHTVASGGGKYTVELIDPDNVQMGVVYGFTIKVDGQSRKAPPVLRQETMYNAEHNQQTNALAQELIKSGVDPATAYETARKATQDNPALTHMMGGNGNGSALPPQGQGDDMLQLMKLAMMRDMMAKPAVPVAPAGESVEVKALKEQMKTMESQRQDERRRADEDRHRSEMQELRGQVGLIAQKLQEPAKEKGPDWAVLATSLGGIFSNMSSQQQAQASSQVQTLEKVLSSQNEGKGDMVSAVMGNMLQMMQFQLQQQQARMQEPLQQMQIMDGMAKTTGGLMQAMVAMQKEMSGDDPAWMRVVLDMASELPEIIKGVSAPVKVRTIHQQPSGQSVSGDELAVRREVEEMQALQRKTDEALGATQEEILPKDATTKEVIDGEAVPLGDMDEGDEKKVVTPREESPDVVAKRVVNTLAIEAFIPLLEFDAWIEYFANLDRDEVEAGVLGYKFVEILMEHQEEEGAVSKELEKLVTDPGPLALALERYLDWSVDRVKEYKEGMQGFIEEHDVHEETP